MSELHFNADKHEYRHDNEIWPGITSILESAGLKEPYQNMYRTTGKGQRVHTATQFLDEGDLDWDSLTDDIKPYVEAYADFKAKTGFKPRLIESPQHSHEHEYATVIDREGELEGVDTVLEIKTFPRQKWWGVQLAGEDEAICSGEAKCLNRVALELRKSGKWKLWDFNDPDDYDCWFACLNIYKWKEKK